MIAVRTGREPRLRVQFSTVAATASVEGYVSLFGRKNPHSSITAEA